MKKVIPAIVVLLIIGACLPTIPLPGLATPTAVSQATSTVSLVPTDTALPSSTPVLANSTATPSSGTSQPDSATASPQPNLTSTLATSTDLPINPTITSQATLAPGQPSLTPTLGILKYGTLPPEVPFNSITLWNRSKAQAYISLQVTLNDGRFSIIEYPVEGQVRIKAPLGSYVYVAWVGGNKLTGSFRLTSDNSLIITLYKDKVVVK